MRQQPHSSGGRNLHRDESRPPEVCGVDLISGPWCATAATRISFQTSCPGCSMPPAWTPNGNSGRLEEAMARHLRWSMAVLGCVFWSVTAAGAETVKVTPLGAAAGE